MEAFVRKLASNRAIGRQARACVRQLLPNNRGFDMKIRNVVKSLAMVGAAAALLPISSAMAAGPGFTGIEVLANTTGTLVGCPTGGGATCKILIDGEGFLQQEVTVGADTFIQTVIIDPLAPADVSASNTNVTTLAFSDITFIQMSGSSNGIAGLQTMRDDPNDGTGDLFNATSELAIGTWADKGVGFADLQIDQTFRNNGGTGVAIGAPGATQTEDDFENTFSLGVNLDGAGLATGKTMDMTQDVGMSDPTVSAPGNDFQRFVIRQRSGDLMTSAGTLTLQPNATSPGTGGTATWAATDDVMVAWLGQRVGLGGLGTSTFGFESVNDVTDGAVISTFSTSSTDVTASPFAWDAGNFGTAPVLP